MRPDLTRPNRGPRAVVLSLLFVGVLTLIVSCGGRRDAFDTVPETQAANTDLSGTDVLVHHAVG